MRLPNFRLHDTQATTSLVLGVLGFICALMLAACVFRGLNTDTRQMVIPYDPDGRLGQFRKPLVFGMSAATVLLGVVAGLIGFNSLGQRRNTKQGRSWLGMASGALAVPIALILFFAWYKLSEPVIKDLG
jgi:uncharacterized membrane protein HdeD (DUF308 family)